MAEVGSRFQSECGSSADWLRDEGFAVEKSGVDVEEGIDDLDITGLNGSE